MIKYLFPTKVSIVKPNIDIVRLQTAVKEICKIYNNSSLTDAYGCLRGNSRLWSSETYDFLSLEIFQEFNRAIQVEIDSFWKELNYSGSPSPLFTAIVEYKHNSYVDVHSHAPVPLVSIFYLQKTKGSDNIMLVDPNADILHYQPHGLDLTSYSDWFNQELQVEEGDLVLFPGYLKHKIKPTMTQEDRIVITTNFGVSY